MLAFFRGLLVFLLGAVVGAVAILLFLPTFSVTFSNRPENRGVAKTTPAKPVVPSKVAEKPAEPAKPAEPVAKVDDKPAEPAKPEEPVAVKPPMKETPAEPAKPEEPVAVKPPMKETPAEPVAKVDDKPAEPAKPTKPAVEEKIDFTLLNGRPIFWPAAVAVTTATSTPLIETGAKVADIPLDVGTTLQISKVLGDGALLVRAQGLQFEIDHRLTDFDAVVRKKIQEVIDAGSKVPPPFKSAPAYIPPIAPLPVIPAPKPTVTAPTPPPTSTGPSSTSPATKPSPTRPSGGSLDDKMNSLFGRRMSEEEKAEAKAAEKKKPAAK
jgi:hypothetical protein